MVDTFRDMCVELLAIVPASGTNNPNSLVVARAHALLAQPEPEGLANLRNAAEQARQTLEGWANYGEWVWPESALEQAKINTTETLTSLNIALAQPNPPAKEFDDKNREAVITAVAEALGSGAYDCLRVWSAWGYGTMGPDDFCLVADDDDRVAEIADAAIEAIRPAPQPPADGEGPSRPAVQPDHATLIGFAAGLEPWATWLQPGGCLESAHCELSDLMLAVLTRWGHPTPQPSTDGDVVKLVTELRHFVAEYQKIRGLDPENIYSLHWGDPEKEAHLRISQLTRAAELLQRQHPQPLPLPTESND